MEDGNVRTATAGTPQGGVISPRLAMLKRKQECKRERIGAAIGAGNPAVAPSGVPNGRSGAS
jgi:retron-type reverse transcriptase